MPSQAISSRKLQLLSNDVNGIVWMENYSTPIMEMIVGEKRDENLLIRKNKQKVFCCAWSAFICELISRDVWANETRVSLEFSSIVFGFQTVDGKLRENYVNNFYDERSALTDMATMECERRTTTRVQGCEECWRWRRESIKCLKRIFKLMEAKDWEIRAFESHEYSEEVRKFSKD